MICEIANFVFFFFYERDFKERRIFLERDSNNNFFKWSWPESSSLETLLCTFHVVQTRSTYSENSDFLIMLHCFSSSIF